MDKDVHSLYRNAGLISPCVYTPMSSRLVQLAVLDALQVALALKLGTTADEKPRATKAALAAGRTQLA